MLLLLFVCVKRAQWLINIVQNHTVPTGTKFSRRTTRSSKCPSAACLKKKKFSRSRDSPSSSSGTLFPRGGDNTLSPPPRASEFARQTRHDCGECGKRTVTRPHEDGTRFEGACDADQQAAAMVALYCWHFAFQQPAAAVVAMTMAKIIYLTFRQRVLSTVFLFFFFFFFIFTSPRANVILL